MTSSFIANLTGSFTGSTVAQNIVLPSGYQKFEIYNITDIGTANTTSVMSAVGTSLMLPGSAYYSVGSGASSINTAKQTATGGFTFIEDSGDQSPGAQLTGSAISSAAPAVVSSANTNGLVAGDVVRMYNTVGMLQIAGMDFTVGTVTPNTSFELAFLDTTQTNLTAGTTSNYRIIPNNPRYYPPRRFITNIESSGVNSIITLSVTNNYTVGQAVRVYVPTNFGTGTNPFITGSVPFNSLTATIVAIGQADASGFTNTITVNVNSSAFTWLWPTSAAFAAGSQVPFVEPVGEAAINTLALPVGNLLDDRTRNVSFRGVQIGTTIQTSGKLYQWIATAGISI
jgi:hypothetical protein